MKKKIVLIVSIMLLAIMSISIFGACEKLSDNFFVDKKIAIDSLPPTTTPIKGSVVEDTKMIDLVGAPSVNGDIVIDKGNCTKRAFVFKNKIDSTYAMYSVNANSIVIPWTKSAITYDKNKQLWKRSNIVDATKNDYIDCEGKVLFTAKEADVKVKNLSTKSAIVFLKCNNHNYYISESLCISQNENILSNLFEETNTANNYFYGKNNIIECEGAKFTVYNTSSFQFECSFDASYLLTDSNEIVSTVALNNGNIVLQIANYLPKEAKKYDFSAPNVNIPSAPIVKVDLTTYIINCSNNIATEVDFDYMFENAYNQNFSDGFVSRFENYGTAVKIDNKNLICKSSLLGFDNNLKLQFASNEGIYANVDKIEVMSANSDYLLTNSLGTYIINSSGQVVCSYNSKLPNATTIDGIGFRLSDNSVVGADGKILYDATVRNRAFVAKFGAMTYYIDKVFVDDGSGTGTKREIENYFCHNAIDNTTTAFGEVFGYSIGSYYQTSSPNNMSNIVSAISGKLLITIDGAKLDDSDAIADNNTYFVVAGKTYLVVDGTIG